MKFKKTSPDKVKPGDIFIDDDGITWVVDYPGGRASIVYFHDSPGYWPSDLLTCIEEGHCVAYDSDVIAQVPFRCISPGRPWLMIAKAKHIKVVR